jgi:hypothetical protein
MGAVQETVSRETKCELPLVVPLAPKYRRCAAYVLFALAFVRYGARWVTDLHPPEKPPDLRFGLEVLVLIALGAVSVLRWRLRVDERGISRRRLVAWQL